MAFDAGVPKAGLVEPNARLKARPVLGKEEDSVSACKSIGAEPRNDRCLFPAKTVS